MTRSWVRHTAIVRVPRIVELTRLPINEVQTDLATLKQTGEVSYVFDQRFQITAKGVQAIEAEAAQPQSAGAPVTILNSTVGSVQIGDHNTAHVQVLSQTGAPMEEVRRLVRELVEVINSLPAEARGALPEHAADLVEEVARQAPKRSRAEAALAMLKKGAEGVLEYGPKILDLAVRISGLLPR